MHFLDNQGTEQDIQESQDALDYQAPNYDDDTSSYDHQDTVQQQVTIQDKVSGFRTFVGVVTKDTHLLRTMKVTMDTWGQSSPNLVFYSLSPIATEEEGDKGVWHAPFEEDEWAWHAPRTKERVVKLKYRTEDVNSLSEGAMETMSVLWHMQAHLIDQFDWFLLLPENLYVQLDKLEEQLKEWDPNTAVIFGRKAAIRHSASGRSHDPAEMGMSHGCGLQRGVVLSRRYMRGLKKEMAAVFGSGACKGQPLLACLYWQVVGEEGLDCVQDESKVRHETGTIGAHTSPPLKGHLPPCQGMRRCLVSLPHGLLSKPSLQSGTARMQHQRLALKIRTQVSFQLEYIMVL